MELGFFTMPLHPPGSNVTRTLEDDLSQLVKLDELGYSEAYIGEHFTFEWENIPAPDLLIAQALGVTKNIRLGTGVNCMPNHNPMMLAHRVAQLDHMSKGRFIWGIGSSSTRGDYEMFGFDPESDERRQYTAETLEAILKIWRDPKPGVYESKNWKFRIPEVENDIGLRFHLTPFTKPHPPIALGGGSIRSGTLSIAGQNGWIPISINLAHTRVVKTHWEAVKAGAKKGNVEPDRKEWRIAREVFVAESSKEARRRAVEGILSRDYEQYWFKLLDSKDNMKHSLNIPDSDINIDYLLDNLWIVGNPEEVAEKIRTLHSDVGGFGTLLAMGHEWSPLDEWVESMTLLAEEVMPSLHDLSI